MKNKGSYYRLKTKKWFIDKGYDCENAEKNQRIFIKGQVIFIKKDIFGADLIAMTTEEIIFANSVLGRKNIASHIKEFNKYKYPDFVKRWIVVWEERAREPEIIEVEKIK